MVDSGWESARPPAAQDIAIPAIPPPSRLSPLTPPPVLRKTAPPPPAPPPFGSPPREAIISLAEADALLEGSVPPSALNALATAQRLPSAFPAALPAPALPPEPGAHTARRNLLVEAMSESYAPGSATPQAIHEAVEAPYAPDAPAWQDLPLPDLHDGSAPSGTSNRSGARLLGMPAWLAIAPLLLATAAGSFVLGAKITSAHKADETATAAPLAPTAPGANAATASAATPSGALAPTTANSAADPTAHTDVAPAKSKEMAAAPVDGRPSSAILARATAKEAQKHADLDELRSKIARDPELAKKPATRDALFRYAAEEGTAADALAAMVALPGALGPDWLSEIATNAKRPETRDLASDLLDAADVRARASAQLAVALDLKHPASCAAAKDVVGRALVQGDKRALAGLAKIKAHTACKAKKGDKADDCYECLHDGTALDDAIKAAKARPAPKL